MTNKPTKEKTINEATGSHKRNNCNGCDPIMGTSNSTDIFGHRIGLEMVLSTLHLQITKVLTPKSEKRSKKIKNPKVLQSNLDPGYLTTDS